MRSIRLAAKRALDWKAPHDFERGLARTIDWYLDQPGVVGGVAGREAMPASGWALRSASSDSRDKGKAA